MAKKVELLQRALVRPAMRTSRSRRASISRDAEDCVCGAADSGLADFRAALDSAARSHAPSLVARVTAGGSGAECAKLSPVSSANRGRPSVDLPRLDGHTKIGEL